MPGQQDGRPPSNPAEREFWDRATEEGWDVTKRGWPDFFIWRNGELACVEVKPEDGRSLKTAQARTLAALADHGIPCYLWNPESGFTKIEPDTPW